MENGEQRIGRRAFLGAAGGMMILKPQLVRGTAANSAVRIGLLGCGGRGREDAEGLVKSGGARLVALADLFDDQLASARKRFDALAAKNSMAGVDASQIFSGPRAFEKIVASQEIDAVVIATPPYFHPEHLAAAVAAGKHVYCEKPVAVDVPGARRVVEIGAKANRRLSLDVGFQIRMAPPFVELVKRIHAGALGEIRHVREIASAEAHYFCGALDRPDWPGASPVTRRVRNWLHDRVLSGDIILEQNIHVIDICNWVLQGHPIKAVGTGGRKGRTDQGDAWSHFCVLFTYANNVHVGFNSTQYGKGGFDANERFFGPRGNSTSPYTGPLEITGQEPWTWSESGQPQGGKFSVANTAATVPIVQAFVESITSGNFHNQAASGAESALSAMLGRMAAYNGREVTWEEMMQANESWDAGIDLDKL